jgi:hypothetical protein
MPQPLFIRFLQPRGWTVVPVFTRRDFATGFPNFYSAVTPVSKYHRICSDTLTPGSSMKRSDLPTLLLDHARLELRF